MKKVLFSSLFMFICAASLLGQTRDFYLYTKMNGRFGLSNYDTVVFWGYGFYSGSQLQPMTLPAPLLNVYTGDVVNLHFKNLSGEQHTIHMHGTDVDTDNDGSPHTSYAVNQNDSTVYEWNVSYTGSYFYHCHVMTIHHLAMGMYGMMVAHHSADTTKLFANGPGFNREYSFLMTDMDTMWSNNPLSPGHFHEYHPSYFMVNGRSDWTLFNDPDQIITMNSGDSVLLHVGNLGYTTNKLTFPPGSNATVHMSDARPLPAAFSTDTLRVYPGERYEIILRPTTTVTGWIQVDYLNAVLDDSLSQNFIGINQFTHPSVVNEIHEISSPNTYPNPASESFNFFSEENGIGRMLDINGRVVREMNILQGWNTVECGGIPEGIYLLQRGDQVSRVIITR